ncbi:unnamed protein product [Bathycoccus prasinos]
MESTSNQKTTPSSSTTNVVVNNDNGFQQQNHYSPSVRSKAMTLLFAAFLCAISLFLSTNDASSFVDVESIEDGRIMREGVDVEEAEKESEVDKFGFESKEEEAEEEEVEEKENKYTKEERDESVLRVFETSNDDESINMTPPDIDYENANKKIVLVGNGRGVLKSRKGEKIDNEHDIVGRFNFFVTKGYERDVGRKLDLWFLNKLKLPGNARFRGSTTTGKSKMNLKMKPTMGYYIPVAFEVSPQCQKKRGPGAKTCVPTSKNKRAIESEKRVLTRRTPGLKSIPTPSLCTGLISSAKTPKIGHYWEKIFKLRTVHSLKLEKQFVGKLIQTGRNGSKATTATSKSSLSRMGAMIILSLFAFVFFSMTTTLGNSSSSSLGGGEGGLGGGEGGLGGGRRRVHTKVANLASESPEMLGLTVQKREKKRETSEDDEKRRRRGGQAKLGANADHVSEKEEEREITITPHVRTNIYDPLPNQFQLNGEPFDFTSLRGFAGLRERFALKDVQIVSYPCNQFGHQEPGTPEEILKFAKEHAYPEDAILMQKVDVNGKNADENWKLLKAAFKNKDVFWNFEKFLVDRNGVPKKRYGSTWSNDIAKDIETLLSEEEEEEEQAGEDL